MFRQLSTTEGRWTTPDPAGIGAVSPGDPQTWNRYAYVGNMPLNAVDPLGLTIGAGNDVFGSARRVGLGYSWSSSMFVTGEGFVPDLGLEPYLPSDDSVYEISGGGGSTGGKVTLANNFTLGIRAPGQPFNGCMQANAGNYSLLGVADFAVNANGQIANNFWLGFTPASNTITNVYNAATGSLTSLFQAGPGIVTAGMGTVVTSGRRTSSIMSLNLPGTPGGPKGGFPALGPAPSNAGQAAKAAAGALKLAVDAGFFLAEGVGCLIDR